MGPDGVAPRLQKLARLRKWPLLEVTIVCVSVNVGVGIFALHEWGLTQTSQTVSIVRWLVFLISMPSLALLFTGKIAFRILRRKFPQSLEESS